VTSSANPLPEALHSTCIRGTASPVPSRSCAWKEQAVPLLDSRLNCEDNPTLRRRSRLKRTQPASPTPATEQDDTETYTLLLHTLNQFPDAKRAVIRALHKKLGHPDDYDDGSGL